VRLALNLAVDKQAIMQQVLGGLGTVGGAAHFFPLNRGRQRHSRSRTPMTRQSQSTPGRDRVSEGFEVDHESDSLARENILPDVERPWPRIGRRWASKSKRRPVDRAVFQADFRARSYAGVTLAFAAGFIARSPGSA